MWSGATGTNWGVRLSYDLFRFYLASFKEFMLIASLTYSKAFLIFILTSLP